MNQIFVFIIRRTQLCRCCIFDLFHTPTCFVCPHQPSSGRTWIRKKSKGKRPLLTNSR